MILLSQSDLNYLKYINLTNNYRTLIDTLQKPWTPPSHIPYHKPKTNAKPFFQHMIVKMKTQLKIGKNRHIVAVKTRSLAVKAS